MPLWVKKGTLRFPEEKDTPVIMVGPGTGVAPFRSALQERIAQGKCGKNFYFSDVVPSLLVKSVPNSTVTNTFLAVVQTTFCSSAVARSPKTSTSSQSGKRKRRPDS